jgi:hypothetical protein
MTRRTLSLAAILTLANALLGATAQAGFIQPIGLAPGSPYQLVFVTSHSIAGTFPTEAPYNQLANSEAALNPLLPPSIWHAVTSTADGTDAKTNAPWLRLPVYNTAGGRVSTPSGLFYVPFLDEPIRFNQFGVQASLYVWTGSSAQDAVGSVGSRLGG